jgi:outer membrane protein
MKFAAQIFLLMSTLAGLSTAQVKLGVINSQKAVLDTAEIKKAQGELETKFKPRQEKVLALQRELEDLQNKLNGGKLPEPSAQEAQATGQRKQRELTRLTEDLQADVERERNEVLQRCGLRMQEVVKQLAEQKGLDVVIDQSNTVFLKPGLDFTAEVTAAYDKAHPVAGK